MEERAKYGQVFETLRPVDGRLHGDKVRPVSCLLLHWIVSNGHLYLAAYLPVLTLSFVAVPHDIIGHIIAVL